MNPSLKTSLSPLPGGAHMCSWCTVKSPLVSLCGHKKQTETWHPHRPLLSNLYRSTSVLNLAIRTWCAPPRNAFVHRVKAAATIFIGLFSTVNSFCASTATFSTWVSFFFYSSVREKQLLPQYDSQISVNPWRETQKLLQRKWGTKSPKRKEQICLPLE